MSAPFASRALLALAVCAALAAPSPAQSRRPLAIEDQDRQRFLDDPQMSPEGDWIAYVVRTSDPEKDERDTDVWMTNWAGDRHVRLTSSTESESTPRWSPDGRYLAFLAARGDDEEKKKGGQVWLLDRAGGEAVRLTDVKGGVSDFAWAPDSRRLVLEVDDPDPADDPEKIEGWKRKTKPPIVIDRFLFKRDRVGYLGGLRSHLALFDVAAKTLEPLTSGTGNETQPAWSPDGRFVAYVGKPGGPEMDRTNDSSLFVVEARAGATPRQLVAYLGPYPAGPVWSPDGARVAFLLGDEPKFYAYNQRRLAVVAAAGGEARVLTAALDREVFAPRWAADGASLRFVVEDDRSAWIGRVPAAGGAVERITKGPTVVRDLAAGPNDRLAALVATDSTLPEVHAVESTGFRPLSHQNDAWLAEVQLGRTEEFSAKAKDGTVVNGLMVKPAGYEAGRRYPTLLLIHGGPNAQDEHAFDFEREYLASRGYVVLNVNYRGSGGRGSAYQKAIFGEWGHKEVVDLLAAVDHAVAAGVADPERLGIGGWSYGGILTNYTIATDPRFKAAVSGAGSSMQIAMYGTDQYIMQYELELGPPWVNPDAWMKVSYPFLKADRIRTPTLFLGGERDFNVPIAGAEQMYQALRSLRIDTQLVIYPGQFHSRFVPSYERDVLARYAAWFDRYLKPAGTH